MDPSLFNATVISRHDLTNELAIVRIRPDAGLIAAFEPGQFCTLGLPPAVPPAPVPAPAPAAVAPAAPDSAPDPAAHLAAVPVLPPPEAPPPEAPPEAPPPATRQPKLIRRAYSIASSPLTRDHVELLVVLVREGKLTPRLWTVEQGGRLFLDPRITGHFTMAGIPEGRDLIMVSTGTGIAPYMSMLRTFRGTGRWRRLFMIHGVRNACDLAYRDELEQISREDRSVMYLPIATREPATSDWTGLRGRVQVLLEAHTFQRLTGSELKPEACNVFLCGNPQMITEVEALLEARGFVTAKKNQPGNIHFERYW